MAKQYSGGKLDPLLTNLEKALKLYKELDDLQTKNFASSVSSEKERIRWIEKREELLKQIEIVAGKKSREQLEGELKLLKERIKSETDYLILKDRELESIKRYKEEEKELNRQAKERKKELEDQAKERKRQLDDLEKFKKAQTKNINKKVDFSWSNAGEYFTQKSNSRTQQQLFNDLYDKEYKKALNSKSPIDTEAIKENILEKMEESSSGFNIASVAIQAGANIFKAGVDKFASLFNQGISNQKSAYRANVLTIGSMTGITNDEQRNVQKNLNNTLGSWLPYSNADDLRDNIRTSEIMNTAGNLASIGFGDKDIKDNPEILYTKALDNIVTSKIVPYLDTSSVLWQQLVSYQPSLQKSIRGISSANMEIVGNNYATKEILDQVLSDLAPMSQLAKDELAMSASGASAAINTLIEAGMTKEDAIAQYKKTYNQKYFGADLLKNGTVAEKLEMINLIQNDIDTTDQSQLGKQVVSNLTSNKQLIDTFGLNFTTGTMNAITSNIGVSALFGNDPTMAKYLGEGGNLSDFNFQEVEQNFEKAYNTVKEKGDQTTDEFLKGYYQSAEEKQEIYMENMTNDFATIIEDMGHWGDVLKTAIDAIPLTLAAGVIGKGIGNLAGLGGAGKGILAAAGGIAVGAMAGAVITSLADGFRDKEKANAAANGESYANQYNIKDEAGNLIGDSASAGALSSYAQQLGRQNDKSIETGFVENFGGNFIQSLSNQLNFNGYDWDDPIKANTEKWDRIMGSSQGAFTQDQMEWLIANYAVALLDAGNSKSIIPDVLGSGITAEGLKAFFNTKYSLDKKSASENDDWAKRQLKAYDLYPVGPNRKFSDYVWAQEDMKSWGVYRLGLDSVPYDNYPAMLHEGEAVLTASTAAELRNLVAEYRAVNSQSINFDAIIQNQTNALVSKMDEIIRSMNTANMFSPNSVAEKLGFINNMKHVRSTKTFG